MTNYNERRDEIIERIRRGMQRELGSASPHLEAGYTRAEAKQALTSLIKELVTEAKPESQSWDGLEPVVQIALSARRKAIDEFEQNLLKALEEV